MKRRIASVRVTCLAAAFTLVTTLAVADPGGQKEYWVERYQHLHSEEQQLRNGLDSARTRYSRGRRGNRLRGAPRAELLADIARLERELARVERELVAFPEEARRAGALPGWFNDDFVAPAPSPAKREKRAIPESSKRTTLNEREKSPAR